MKCNVYIFINSVVCDEKKKLNRIIVNVYAIFVLENHSSRKHLKVRVGLVTNFSDGRQVTSTFVAGILTAMKIGESTVLCYNSRIFLYHAVANRNNFLHCHEIDFVHISIFFLHSVGFSLLLNARLP